jgi:riboflavin synthase
LGWSQFTVPANLSRYIAPQGSITVDGISLTVAGMDGDEVSIAVIPHTYAATALHSLRAGGPLNIEVDVLAKYAERQAQQKEAGADAGRWAVTDEYLLANGY